MGDTAKKTQEAAEEKAKEIQSQIDDLNEHATAAQKKSREAAAEATNDATVASKQAMAAKSAAEHAKKLEEEQKKIVADTTATAATKKAAADAAQATADKLNAIAGAATKKLNDAKKAQEEVEAAAKLKQEAEEKTVAAKNAEAAKIKAAADKVVNEATAKKTAAEGMLSKIDNAQCKKHTGCSGLEGYCCPTLNTNKMHLGSTKLDGAMLGCCGSAMEMGELPLFIDLFTNHMQSTMPYMPPPPVLKCVNTKATAVITACPRLAHTSSCTPACNDAFEDYISSLDGSCCRNDPTEEEECRASEKTGVQRIQQMFNQMCGKQEEMVTIEAQSGDHRVVQLATNDATVAASASGNFGITSMLLAAISGCAVTAMVFKLTSGTEEKNAPYQPLA